MLDLRRKATTVNTLTAFVKRHPLAVYFILAYALSWTMVALYSTGFIFALLALFGPALAAIPGLQYYLYGFPAFLFFVVAQTLLFTWLFKHTRGSVLLAWIFHAWINISNSLLFVGDPITQWWLVGAGFALVAVVMVLAGGRDLARSASTAAVQP